MKVLITENQYNNIMEDDDDFDFISKSKEKAAELISTGDDANIAIGLQFLVNAQIDVVEWYQETYGELDNLLRKSTISRHLKEGDSIENIIHNIKEFTTTEGIGFSNIDIPIISDAILQLKNLNSLNVYKCNLAHLPTNIHELKHLEYLDVQQNQLTSLPENITKLKELKVLSVTQNPLKYLPDSFGNLKKLEQMKAVNCNLQSLPDSFVDLTNLVALALPWNELTTLPEGFDKLTNLGKLLLSGNKITHLPNSFYNSTIFQRFTMLMNPLSYGTKAKLKIAFPNVSISTD